MKDHRNLAFVEIPICWMQRDVTALITTSEDGYTSCDLSFESPSRIEYLWTGQEWSVLLSTDINDFPRFTTPRTGRIGVSKDKVVWLGHNCYFHGEDAFEEEVDYLKGLRKH